MRPRHPNKTRQDDFRQALRLSRKEKTSRQVNLSIRESSRRRLNWLRDNHFKSDDQSMAIDLICLRLSGSLEPWGGRPMNEMAQELQKMYDSEINLAIGWFWDGGIVNRTGIIGE